jgi:hypothetical protein
MILSWLDNWAQNYNCVALSNVATMAHETLTDNYVINPMIKNVVFMVHISVLTDENES